LVIFSSGNNYADVEDTNLNVQAYAGLADVMLVGATGPDDNYSIYSNYGLPLSIVAPSSAKLFNNDQPTIDTTDRTGANGYNWSSDYTGSGDYGFGGTSAAAPIVAGAAALVLS